MHELKGLKNTYFDRLQQHGSAIGQFPNVTPQTHFGLRFFSVLIKREKKNVNKACTGNLY